MKNIRLSFTPGAYGEYSAVLVGFAITNDEVLRDTSEYTLIYVPETDEWYGIGMSYGRWFELSPKEIEQLRSTEGLEDFVGSYLEHFN